VIIILFGGGGECNSEGRVFRAGCNGRLQEADVCDWGTRRQWSVVATAVIHTEHLAHTPGSNSRHGYRNFGF
jgi:hypothetical protein